MKKLCVIFLILSGCVVATPQKFSGDWKFLLDKDGNAMACLSHSDVIELKEALVRCERGSD